MLIDDLKVLLSEAIENRDPVMVTGAPGIGKSDLFWWAASDADADIILSHPAVSDPTDIKGLPWVVDGAASFLAFGDLRRAIEATRPTVWVFDDLGQATPAVQASAMQLFLAREVNGHKISPFVTFFAATNRRTDRAGVSGILEPVKSRFITIVELQADILSWCRWALDHDVPPELIAFLRSFPDLLSAFVPSADLTNSPCPRTWAHAARLLRYKRLSASARHEALSGAVGEAAANQLLVYLRMYAELVNVDQILLNPATAPIPTSPSQLYAIVSALAYRATAGNFDRIGQYITRLMDGHREFAALCVKDSVRRHPETTQTAAYVRLAVGDFGQLLSGSAL
jgi:hypothetical protein